MDNEVERDKMLEAVGPRPILNAVSRCFTNESVTFLDSDSPSDKKYGEAFKQMGNGMETLSEELQEAIEREERDEGYADYCTQL